MHRPHRPRARLGADHAASTSRASRGPNGALYVGSPETVAQKIAATRCAPSALSRFDLKYSNGTLPHDELMLSIERYATEVVPRVRELLAAADAADAKLDSAATGSAG